MATKKEVFENGDSLMDCPIDVNMDGEQESNGSTEHLIYYEGEFYYLQVGWGGELGRISKFSKKNLKIELDENPEGEISKYIKENNIKV